MSTSTPTSTSGLRVTNTTTTTFEAPNLLIENDADISGVIAVGILVAFIWLIAVVAIVAALVRIHHRSKTGSLELWLQPVKRFLLILFLVWALSMFFLDTWWMSGRIAASSPLILQKIVVESICRPWCYCIIAGLLLLDASDIIRLKFFLLEQRRRKKEERIFAGETSDDDGGGDGDQEVPDSSSSSSSNSSRSSSNSSPSDSTKPPHPDGNVNNIKSNDGAIDVSSSNNSFDHAQRDEKRNNAAAYNNNNNNNHEKFEVNMYLGEVNTNAFGNAAGGIEMSNAGASNSTASTTKNKSAKPNEQKQNKINDDHNNNEKNNAKISKINISAPATFDNSRQKNLHEISIFENHHGNNGNDDDDDNDEDGDDRDGENNGADLRNGDVDQSSDEDDEREDAFFSGRHGDTDELHPGTKDRRTGRSSSKKLPSSSATDASTSPTKKNNINTTNNNDFGAAVASSKNAAVSTTPVIFPRTNANVSNNKSAVTFLPEPTTIAKQHQPQQQQGTNAGINSFNTNLFLFPLPPTATSSSSTTVVPVPVPVDPAMTMLTSAYSAEMNRGLRMRTHINQRLVPHVLAQMNNRNQSNNTNNEPTNATTNNNIFFPNQNDMPNNKNDDSGSGGSGGGRGDDRGGNHSSASTSNEENASSTISSNPYQNANVPNPFSLSGIPYTIKDAHSNIFSLSPVKLLRATVKHFVWAKIVAAGLFLYLGLFVIVAVVDAGYSSSTPQRDCEVNPPAAAYCCRAMLDQTPNQRAYLIEEPLLFDGLEWILSLAFAFFWWFAAYFRIKKKWNVAAAARFYVVYLLVGGFTTIRAVISTAMLISSFRRNGGSFLAIRSIAYVMDACFVGVLALHFARFWREKPRMNREPGVILI